MDCDGLCIIIDGLSIINQPDWGTNGYHHVSLQPQALWHETPPRPASRTKASLAAPVKPGG